MQTGISISGDLRKGPWALTGILLSVLVLGSYSFSPSTPSCSLSPSGPPPFVSCFLLLPLLLLAGVARACSGRVECGFPQDADTPSSRGPCGVGGGALR